MWQLLSQTVYEVTREVTLRPRDVSVSHISVAVATVTHPHLPVPPGVTCAASRRTDELFSRVTWRNTANGSAAPSRCTAACATTRPIRRQRWGLTPTHTCRGTWEPAQRWGELTSPVWLMQVFKYSYTPATWTVWLTTNWNNIYNV